MTRREALDYEVRASWWAGRVGWPWLQRRASAYFARKVRRKWARYQRSVAVAQKLRAAGLLPERQCRFCGGLPHPPGLACNQQLLLDRGRT
jgi:hypothetical protein